MAGYPVARADIDNQAGNLCVSLRNLFDQVDNFKTFLDTMTDQQLQSPPQNYSNQEVAVLKSAFTDLSNLAKIYRGQLAQPTAYDFQTFAKQLTGVL